jgi:hypothetical protein
MPSISKKSPGSTAGDRTPAHRLPWARVAGLIIMMGVFIG